MLVSLKRVAPNIKFVKGSVKLAVLVGAGVDMFVAKVLELVW